MGSVGLPALIGLFAGRDDDDLLVLQFKAAEASVLEQWTMPSPYEHHGQRVVVGQRLMQAAGDPFSAGSPDRVPGRWSSMAASCATSKWSLDLAGIGIVRLQGYARLCGATLAMAHARGGDPIAIAAYLGKSAAFPEAVGEFALTYANLTEADYADFVEAINSGEIQAAEGTFGQ